MSELMRLVIALAFGWGWAWCLGKLVAFAWPAAEPWFFYGSGLVFSYAWMRRMDLLGLFWAILLMVVIAIMSSQARL